MDVGILIKEHQTNQLNCYGSIAFNKTKGEEMCEVHITKTACAKQQRKCRNTKL